MHVKRRCVTERTEDGLSDRVRVEWGEQKLRLSSRVLSSLTPPHTAHTTSEEASGLLGKSKPSFLPLPPLRTVGKPEQSVPDG